MTKEKIKLLQREQIEISDKLATIDLDSPDYINLIKRYKEIKKLLNEIEI